MGDIDLKVISAAENSNKFQKTRFWKEKISSGRGNTWANGTSHTSTYITSHVETPPVGCDNFV